MDCVICSDDIANVAQCGCTCVYYNSLAVEFSSGRDARTCVITCVKGARVLFSGSVYMCDNLFRTSCASWIGIVGYPTAEAGSGLLVFRSMYSGKRWACSEVVDARGVSGPSLYHG